MIVAMKDESQHVISGLLKKRESLLRQAADLRAQMAVNAGDIEAVDRTLDAFGFQGELEGKMTRGVRIILFYRNELFLTEELRKASKPMTTRELAQAICHVKGKQSADRRLLADVTKRAARMRRVRTLAARIVVFRVRS
jgi:hypothetical protein